ncbi:SMI1/KNR4 family protein [Streptomyces sp. WAC 06738]|uniref:SMI1/KNR4 family protein n=1 Tax=Streptomyces sp. WAC 06738 TaxID=2203210 RepID=UPI000F6C3CF6|nr:SMI1/KNR4 family protein [Streptomyces sp. WAC 06738]AZM49804.1 SMI1/KNR4 family protein [Streptomyces sp. WAC 06738]
MGGDGFDWHGFLGRWQEEWVPRADEQEDEGGEGARFALGRAGAAEAVIVAAEERLGLRLPESYREFLAVSDGWHVDETAGVHQLGGAADIDWFRDPYGQSSVHEEHLGDDPRAEDVLLAGMWRRALRLETDSDMSHALLDPGDVGPDGEWALYLYHGWSGEEPDRYPSFRVYLEAMYRDFHHSRAERADFVNATTRAQDARVEDARRLALRGRYEEALPLLEEAVSYGRPGSAVLLNQLRYVRAPGSPRAYGELVADPRYQPELLPVEATTEQRDGRPDGDDQWLRMMVARGVDRETAEAVLHAVRNGTHVYAPPGPWGRAVAGAREAARWGLTDDAWRILRGALPSWEAPGPALIAPVGLLADPVLGPLVTPERGREILATPRAGESGPAPEPVPGLDPPGLAWLAEPAANRRPGDGYRVVWIEGADPAGLPALIGEEGAGLSAPADPRRASWGAPGPHEREGVELWEDRPVVAVGRTAEGWAFAADINSHRYLTGLFRSPAAAASAAGRAVVLWREPTSHLAGRPTVFHLSVAERGEELWAFTVRGAKAECSGAIPDALDPARLFRPEETEQEREARLLAVLQAELGLSLPRFALTRGRLPTLTTRSWTREPREGEGFAYAFLTSGPYRS